MCLWNVSIQEDSVHSCTPLDDEDTTAFPSEEDDSMREWRQEFPEKMRRAIIRIHTNLGHPQNSILAKRISDAGGSDEKIKCANRYPCSVCKRMSRPRLRRLVSVPRTRQFNDTLLADVHFWNFRGREVLVYSMIDEATRFHVIQILPSQSARDLYEPIMTARVKWAGAPSVLLVDPHKSHLTRQFIEQLGAQGATVLVGAAEDSWTRGLVERHGAYVRSMVEKMFHDGVPDDMSAQSLFDRATSAKNMMSRIATQPRIPESLIRQDNKTMLHLCHSPMSRCLILDLQKHSMKVLKRPMMIVRTLLNLFRTAAVHTGNGDQSTKCFFQNLVILG